MVVGKIYRRLRLWIQSFGGASFKKLGKEPYIHLYAGDVPVREEYNKFTGLSLWQANGRHIKHDVTKPYQLPDNSVEMYQSEDVFEHIEFEKMPAIVNEIFRVLKPGGIFRLCLPDYRCDILNERSIKNASGEIVFDPGGGGEYVNGKLQNGAHLWFPRYELVKGMLEHTAFKQLNFYHYYDEQGTPVTRKIDHSIGLVLRTPDFDERVQNPYRPMSIVVDCVKG